MGRPKKKRDTVRRGFQINLSESEHAYLEQAALAAGLPMATFARLKLMEIVNPDAPSLQLGRA